MKQPRFTVNIERLVLTDLGLTPQQTEQLRQALADELAGRLAESGPPQLSGTGDMESAALPPISWPGAGTIHRLAGDLAQGISQALSGVGLNRPRR